MTKYSGLFIDFDRVLAPKGKLVANMATNLKAMSTNCDNLALGTNNVVNLSQQYIPFPDLPYAGPNTVRALILILPTTTVARYSQTPPDDVLQELNNGSQFNQSIGHCYVLWDKQTNICGIFDVCLHNLFIQKGGMGTIFMDTVMDSILTNFPNNTVIWAGVDLRNQHFTKVISLYAKFGFKMPFVSFNDPFGNNHQASLPHGFVSLHRVNDYIDASYIDRDGVISDTAYMVQQYAKVTKRKALQLPSILSVKSGIDTDVGYGAENFCTIQAKFDIPFAKWLAKLPQSASTLNANGTVTQKEVGGAFWLDNPTIGQDGLFTWDIMLYANKGINATREETVDMVVGRYNFHTHPKAAYRNHNVFIGFPSGQDYWAFLTASLFNNTVFHCVVTLEGIYVISLNPDWANNMADLKIMYEKQKGSLYTFVGQTFEIPKVIPAGMNAEQTARSYPTTINAMPLFKSYPPVFHSDFVSWDEINSGKVIGIAYPVIYQQCFATERSIDAIRRLHPNLK